ncbi:MAG TPA: hypothetical protein VK059_00795 [Nocardioidaceae bacterium]|nr:hypothetical protein [Nocardioidaceae bacterium]
MKTILVLAVVLVGCVPARSAPEPQPPESRWASVLQRLDDRRERAYVRGDPSLLDRVYVRGSAVRRADTRLLRAYVRRGLHVEAVPMRLRDIEVVSRRDRRVRLRVVDRLGVVRVRHAGGPWRALPADQPTEHVITLYRAGDDWRIARIARVAG